VSLIDELYDSKSANIIRSLYSNDPESRKSLYTEFGRKIVEKTEIFLTSKPLDILCLVCMTAQFADSEKECQDVAIIIHNRMKEDNPLPYVMEDKGLLLAEKTLIALAFFPAAMEKRWKYHGAPSPKFYRNTSKIVFSRHGLNNIADHHEQWESFLSEIFV
jgi:hypothetical protein